MTDESSARSGASDRVPDSRGHCAPEELALDLTSEAVRLVARNAGGAWTELGAVPLASGDFRAALDALRQRAAAHGARAVTLWLPPDQILVRRYVLKRGDRAAEALRRLGEDTGHRPDELTVALSPAADGELVTVLGTFRQTVAEAVDYARRWGFRPGRVSTRVEAERFGAAGPAFDMPHSTARRAGRWPRRALAAAAAAVVIGVASWGAYGLLPASDRDSVAAALAPEAAEHPVGERPSKAPPAMASRHAAGSPHDERVAPVEPTESRLARAGEPSAGGAVPLPELAAAAPDAPARLGRGSTAPERRGPAVRPQSAAPEAGANLDGLLAGIDRIQDDAGEDPAGREASPEDESVVAASDAAPVVVPGRPMPRPDDPGMAETATEPGAEAEGEVIVAEGKVIEGEGDLFEAEGSDLPTPAVVASDSSLAAIEAPRPPVRPNRPRQSNLAVAPQWEATPPRIGNAAAQGSMALDATSLIGVIDANSGREALLRTPSGDFLKVARGDEVAGWRVNAIGQDAMRLTRGGESRTLLLVTR